MESSSLLFILFLTLITIIILVLRLLGNNITSAGNKHHLPLPPPPGPWRLPIIGNIHQLISNLPHRRLRHLAHKYGPDVMQLQLGQLHHIIISSAEAARQLRKLVVVELLGANRVRSFRSVREGEVWGMVENLYRSADKEEEVELGKALFGLTMRVTNRTAFGKVRGKVDEEEFYKLMEKIADVMGGLKISDLFPSLKWLPVMNGYKGQLMEIHRQVDGMLDYIISVYKERRTRSTDNKGHGETMEDDDDDLVDVLLNLEESGHLGFTLTLDHVKAVTLVETTAISMDWTMAELMRNPRVMQKVQKEVRELYIEKRTVDEESIHELKYLELVIQESLRLHPSLPLLLPRENHERAEIMGYEIQPKTKVIINSWAIGRDPRYWVEPEKFYPTNKNYKGTDNFEYIPFGAGRRMCPGISYASAIMKLTLANMLFHFDWKLQVGLNPENLDMTERFGASVRRDGILSLIPVAYHSL
ncbi:Premnaspirodiene oxygenase [Linum perenne]